MTSEEQQKRRSLVLQKLRSPLPCVEIIACDAHNHAGSHIKTHAPKAKQWGQNSRNRIKIDGWHCDPGNGSAQLHYTCPLCGCLAVIRYARHVGAVSCCGEPIVQHEIYLVPR